MRRNLRLALVLLLLCTLLYISISLLDDATSTPQNTSPNSVSDLTDHFSASLPTKLETRNSRTHVRATIRQPSNIKDRAKIAQSSEIQIRIKAKVHRNVKNSTKIQLLPEFEKQAKRRKKTLPAERKHRSNTGSGHGLPSSSKTELDNKIDGSSRLPSPISRPLPTTRVYSIASPNVPGSSRLHGRIAQPTTPRTRAQSAKNKVLESIVTSSRFHVSPKRQPQERVKFRAKPESPSVQVRKMSKKPRNSTGSVRKSGTNVIIVAHGRSGSSFFGGIFNAHPDFFFMYEPLNQLKRIVNQYSEEYLYSGAHVIKSLINCNFKDNEFLRMMSRHTHHRASCRPLISPPFCNTTYESAIHFVATRNWNLCHENISAQVLNDICRKHENIAAKILLERLGPVDLAWILHVASSQPLPNLSLRKSRPTESTGDEDKPAHLLYLVRDPRAIIYSRDRLGWVVPRARHEHAFESGEGEEKVRKVCDAIEQNLGAVLLNPQRVTLIRYEDLATNPEVKVKQLFSDLRISPSADVFRWIYKKTHGPVNMGAVSLSRNANTSINAWRIKIPEILLEIVETQCARVMKYLGYLPSNGSTEILRNLRKPLYLSKMADLKESFKWPVE